jgi:hypothetical protein
MSSVGNATAQDIPQAPSQTEMKWGTGPTLRSVLTIETMHVMNIESSSGKTIAP